VSVNVTAKIRLALQIDIGSGVPNYQALSSTEQHDEKMKLLEDLSKPQTLTYLGWWSALLVTVDNDYQSVELPGTYPDETKKYLENTFAAVAGSWSTELGFVPGIGDLLPQQLCTKMPDCSHDCRHTYYVTKPTANPAIRLPWKVGPTSGNSPHGVYKGVTANVTVFIEWSTPSMQMAPMGGGDSMQMVASAPSPQVQDGTQAHAAAVGLGAPHATQPATAPRLSGDTPRLPPNR
jgi:hypothetical protein